MSDETDLLQKIAESLNESLSSKFITDEVIQKLELVLASILHDINSASESMKRAASA
jgi:hypothetical protein